MIHKTRLTKADNKTMKCYSKKTNQVNVFHSPSEPQGHNRTTPRFTS